MEKKLQVRSLRISFRTISGKLQAVRDISFDLNKGETLAIVGESGSGKSVTSKAILGILAGNAIIEGGEILYDGQDLLKISEDDFYRLRGDRISMIFQDPLSSLNPIMRIGKQLTEAMLLKGKARQRAGRLAYARKMKLLEANLAASGASDAPRSKDLCDRYRKVIDGQIRMERSYNHARESALEALEEISNLTFLIEKNALKDGAARFREVAALAGDAGDAHVVSDAEALKKLCADVRNAAGRNIGADGLRALAALEACLKQATEREAPDFFELSRKSVPDADTHFLGEFTDKTQRAIEHLDGISQRAREDALSALRKMRDSYAGGEFVEDVDALCRQVTATIQPMDVVKDSIVYTFPGSLRGFVEQYRHGKRTNAGKLKKYGRQTRRHERLEARGKKPNWTVAAPSVVDFDQVRANVLALIDRLIAHYEALNRGPTSAEARAKDFLNSIERDASASVNRVTRGKARRRALKLMDEVGIPEPRKRYRDYPFQFSGGMRQRIVIAIALAADPDILICDEPTTALDVTIQAQILELINRIKKERDLSVIFITHDLGVVANMADRIAVMYAGKIVEYGLSEEIFYEPAHPYTWALLSSMPDLDTKEKLEAIPGTPPNMIYPPRGDAFAARNRYAMRIDFEKQPPAFPITPTHWAATWLRHPDAPKVDMPQTVAARIEKMKQRTEGDGAL